MEEKRREPRIKVNWPIRVFLDNSRIEGKLVNININGISIRCKDPIHTGKNVSVSIFPPSYKPIKIVGKIVWSDFYALDMSNNNVPVCIGLIFVEISPKDQHILKEILEIHIE